MGEAVDAVGNAVDSVVDTAAGVVDKIVSDPKSLIVTAAVMYATGGLGGLETLGADAFADAALADSITAGWETATASSVAAPMTEAALTGVADAAATTGASGVAAGAAPAAETISAAQQALGPSATPQGLLDSGFPGDPASQFSPPVAATAPTPPPVAPTTGARGLLDSVGDLAKGAGDWAKANPTITAAGMITGGSMLKGVGDRAGALELADKKAANDRALLDQRTKQSMDVEEWRRRFSQGGMMSTPLPFAPSGRPLQRPDGTPVYGSSGLLNS
jgi:hypothetical protein